MMTLNARPLLKAAVLVAAGCGALRAQAIVPAQTQISLSAQPGAVSSTTVTVNSSGAPLALTLRANMFPSGNWLSVNPSTGVTPADFKVVTDASLLIAGVYYGEILITAPGATNQPVAIGVTFTVGSAGTGTLSAVPPSLSFTGQVGGLTPGPKTLAIATAPAGVAFAASASTESTISWLQVSPVNGIAPAPVTVSVVTAALPPGSYNGSVVLTPANGPAVTVPVTLNIASGSVLSVSASSLQFYYQIGSFLPFSDSFYVGTSAGAPLSFAISFITNDGRPWLFASPPIANTPQTVTVSVLPTGLGPGIYTGKVNVSAPSAANSSVDIPVTLTVSNSPLLTVGSFPARFTQQVDGAPPPSQSVVLGSSTGTLDYTTSVSVQGGTTWLSVSPPSGRTPQSLTLSVTPSGLPPGTYSGTVMISASGAGNSPVSVPVTLTIADTSTLSSTVQSINLNYQIGGFNQVVAQLMNISSGSQAVPVTATASTVNCGANWLRVFPESFTTPSAVTVALETLGFNLPADCSGYVTFTPTLGGQSLQIPVTLKVSNMRLFNITPLALTLSAPFDGSPTSPQRIALSTTDNAAVAFTVIPATLGGGSWLRVNADSTTTPATLQVTADPGNLSVGAYSGSILISSTGLAAAQSIPVTFRVTSTNAGAVSPLALSFTQVVGSPPPGAKSLALASTGAPTSFVATTTTSNAVGWLFATPNTGSTPSSITVTVNGTGLSPGSYSGTIVVTMPAASNSPLSIPVSLTVASARTLSADVSALSFSYRSGEPAPPAQQVRVVSAGDPVGVSAASTIANGTAWLSVSPASATTPAAFNVSVTPVGLPAGTYSGTVTFTAPGSPGSPITIPVTLDVVGAPVPAITELYNAASGIRGAIAPGEILTIKGSSLGPRIGVNLRLTPAGTVVTMLEGVRVLFDNFEAPLLYASAGQINLVAPYEIAGANTVRVVVEYQGVRSTALTYQVAATAPGIFTAAQTGRGQGAILNQDNTYNSAAIPAEKGSIVQVFATGEGLVQPAAATGSLTQGLHNAVAKVTAMVGGIDAQVLFSGAAPEAVAGLFQVNVRIPANAPSGDVPILLNAGGVASQPAVTVAVR